MTKRDRGAGMYVTVLMSSTRVTSVEIIYWFNLVCIPDVTFNSDNLLRFRPITTNIKTFIPPESKKYKNKVFFGSIPYSTPALLTLQDRTLIHHSNTVTQKSHFLYGLQAAMSLSPCVSISACPLIVWSHMISLISPISSVVLASSKNRTVCMPGNSTLLFWACATASLTLRSMSLAAVPPCTCTHYKSTLHKKPTWMKTENM